MIYGVDLTATRISTGTRYDLKDLAQRIVDRNPYSRIFETVPAGAR